MPKKLTADDVKRRPDLYRECPGCSKVLRIQGKTFRELCNVCAANPVNWSHGELNTYKRRGCRCDICKRAPRESQTNVRRKAATRYKYICAHLECRTEFTSHEANRKYCSVLCGIRAAQSIYASSFRTPVLYDAEFARSQQQRVDSGKFEIELHLTTWIDARRRHALYELHNWTCQECGVLCSRRTQDDGLPTITLDHLLARTRWPENHPLMHDDFNLTVLCHACNSRKFNHFTNRSWISLLVLLGDLSVEDARARRRDQIGKYIRKEALDDNL